MLLQSADLERYTKSADCNNMNLYTLSRSSAELERYTEKEI